MQIKFFGCRGSIPAPLNFAQIKDLFKYLYEIAIKHNIDPKNITDFLDQQQNNNPYFFGGNTSANLIQDDDNILILEAGSGLREMATGFMQEKRKEYHILMGHFHWDHIQGLPFFIPAFIPGNTIHVYSVQPYAEEVFKKQMSSPTFPVDFSLLGANFIFHQIKPAQEIQINNFTVNTLEMHHPDGCWGYQINSNNKRICYLSDTEITNANSTTIKNYADFVGDADIVIADSQYSFVEYFKKQHWGHSNITTFIDILKNSNVKKLIMYHHDPMANFQSINKSLEIAKRYQTLTAPDSSFEISTAQEGLTIQA